MATIEFYNFDITTGSAIQAEALFSIFDDLAGLVARKISSTNNLVNGENQLDSVIKNEKGYP